MAKQESNQSVTQSERTRARERKAIKERNQKRQKLLAVLVLGVIVINGLLGYWLYGTMVEDVQRERLERLTEQEATNRARKVGNYLQELRAQVAEAAAMPGLVDALANPDARTAQAQAVADQFPESLAVRLIPVGRAELDRDHAVPISFAERAFIRRAERREPTPPEMAQVGDSWQLHLIEPLPPEQEQPVMGTLLVTLDGSNLLQRAGVAAPALGQTRLIQQIPGSSSQLLAQTGSSTAEPGNQVASHQVAVPGSHWRLSFTPSEALAAQARELPTLWMLTLCATSIGGLLLVWLISHLAVRPPAPARPANGPEPVAETPDAPQPSPQEPANPLYQNQDILDIEVADEDEDILGLDGAEGKTSSAGKASAQPGQTQSNRNRPDGRPPGLDLPNEIFRSYDIRGLADSQLTPELTGHIGRALGSEAQDQGDTHMVVARDGRTHSPELTEHLITGITRSGCHVIDLGVVPTPLMYFATKHLSATNSGVIVTASHNPAEYNGFKMVIDGTTLSDDAVLDVKGRVSRQQYHSGQGEVETLDIVPDYIERIVSDVALLESVSLVIDAGNAVTGTVAPRLFEELGCDVTPLYCELDGRFPNHDPDPTQEANLRDLIAKVQEVGADMGVAFDGDGDRLVVVTPSGQIIWPDHLLMLFARDILSRHPGADVVFDVKCSRQLNQLVTSYGGRPIMWKTGHSPMKAKMVETGALIGGEYSGHIFIKDRWYGFDDGLYAMARLLEIITLRDQGIDEVFAAFPMLPSTPELKISVPESDKVVLVEKLIREGDFKNGKASTIDGLRVDFGKGWGLVRASNTSAALTLRFEAETEEALATIQQLFKRELLKISSSLKIDF